ncbi:hypothetical protein YC2023_030040 [Brassica napus]
MRLQAVEADKESMKRRLLSMRTEKAQMIVPPRPSMANGSPRPLSRYVGLIPSNEQCVNFSKVRKSCLLIMQLPSDLFPCFGFGIANHFLIGHPYFHYSISSTLNPRVLNACVTENSAALPLRTTTSLKTPFRSEPTWLTRFDTTCNVHAIHG